MRATVLLLLLAAAAAVVISGRHVPAEARSQQLTWIATAHQYGPVGYRDPAAAISPDARWIAYSEGRFLRVRAIGGGPVTEFPPATAQIRHLSWRADNKTVLAGGDLYDRVAGTRTALWPNRTDLLAHDGPVAATVSNGDLLRQAVWSR